MRVTVGTNLYLGSRPIPNVKQRRARLAYVTLRYVTLSYVTLTLRDGYAVGVAIQIANIPATRFSLATYPPFLSGAATATTQKGCFYFLLRRNESVPLEFPVTTLASTVKMSRCV